MDVSILQLQEEIELLSDKLKEEKDLRIKAEENLVDVIWQMDLRLKFTYVSSSIYNMTGYSVDEWIGSYLHQHASMREFFKMAREALGAIKNYKTFKYIEFRANMIKKNGEEYPVEIVGRVLLSDKGLPIGVQGSTRDITRRKRLEDELASHTENMEQLVKQRTSDLEEKNKELKRLNELFVGREFRIKELRDELEALKDSI